MGDILASIASVLAVLSHAVQLLQPIATFALTALGVVWWGIRLAHYRRTGMLGESSYLAGLSEGGVDEEEKKS